MDIPNDPRAAFDVVQQARNDLTQRIMDAAEGSPEEHAFRRARRACRVFVDGAGRYGDAYASDPAAFALALDTVRKDVAGVSACSCGVPSEARYHVSAVIGHEENWLGAIGRAAADKDGVDTDVRDVDGFYCGRHVPSRRDLITGELARYNFAVLAYSRDRLR